MQKLALSNLIFSFLVSSCIADKNEKVFVNSRNSQIDSILMDYHEMINRLGDSNIILVSFTLENDQQIMKVGNNPFIPNSNFIKGCKKFNDDIFVFISKNNTEDLFAKFVNTKLVSYNSIEGYPHENDSINFGIWDPIVWKFNIDSCYKFKRAKN